MANFQKISNKIQKLIIDNPKTKQEYLSWYNITNANRSEFEFLRKNFGFSLSELHASSPKTFSQRPTVNQNEDYLFLILHFPVLRDGSIYPEEIEFFIGHGYLVTIHNDQLRPLNDFFNLIKKDTNTTMSLELESSAILLYEILDKLMQNCYEILDQNSIQISRVEKTIFAEEQKMAVSDILSLRRNIISYRRIMQNHKNILKKLMMMESSIVPAEDIKKYYSKLIESAKRIWENLESQKEMVEILYYTNESMLNYQMNSIMKTLTIFSVIVLPLNLLAGIFGMNFMDSMPFVGDAFGFYIIISIMLIASLAMLLFFVRKKWL